MATLTCWWSMLQCLPDSADLAKAHAAVLWGLLTFSEATSKLRCGRTYAVISCAKMPRVAPHDPALSISLLATSVSQNGRVANRGTVSFGISAGTHAKFDV